MTQDPGSTTNVLWWWAGCGPARTFPLELAPPRMCLTCRVPNMLSVALASSTVELRIFFFKMAFLKISSWEFSFGKG